MTFNPTEVHNEFKLELIVRAIDKAIAVDVPNHLQEYPLETINNTNAIRSDFINQNLRDFCLRDGYDLIPIQRYGWHGRLIVNHEKKITLSIVTQSNLRTIPRKKRSRPHYTMSILKTQNNDLNGYVQQSLFPTPTFDDDAFEADYKSIMAKATISPKDYHHYFVAYRASSNEVTDVKLVLMDPMFNTVHVESLNHLLRPDFAHLTEVRDDRSIAITEESHRKATRQLTKLKLGLRKVEEQA